VAQHPDTVRRVVGDMRLHLPLAGIVDRSAETSRAERELGKLAKQLASLNGKLGNPKFRERAAPAVVAEAEAQLEVTQRRREQLERMLAELTG
jgi:valyl-tRNA synthetase